MKFLSFISVIFLIAVALNCSGQQKNKASSIITGADQTKAYLPYLKGKRVGMMVNQTSIIGKRASVDSLHALGINITAIFGPEHGFRGNASAGDEVKDEVDVKTGIPVISLYGKKNKPSKEDMNKLDVMVYDLQDVGCRFYTNINALARIMEACAENSKELIILDRPNPNAFIDGPILDMKFKSGIGMFPLPITHGLTVAEFAQMANGQGWLANKVQCKLTIIKVKNYKHDMYYELPVHPSPNLNTQQSIMLYPSLCPFEGTIISQGRGTYMPFTVLGAPLLKGRYTFSFKPVGIPGMAETPLHQDQDCYGLDLRNVDVKKLHASGRFNLSWMIELYKAYPDKAKFFDSSQSKQMGRIERLIGTDQLEKQLAAGMSEAEIRKTWEPGLAAYKKMRVQYLLYN